MNNTSSSSTSSSTSSTSTPSFITARLNDLNRKVGIFAQVDWSRNGWDNSHYADEEVPFEEINGSCYVVTNCVTGRNFGVRTMSDAFNAAWRLFKHYRGLERRGF